MDGANPDRLARQQQLTRVQKGRYSRGDSSKRAKGLQNRSLSGTQNDPRFPAAVSCSSDVSSIWMCHFLRISAFLGGCSLRDTKNNTYFEGSLSTDLSFCVGLPRCIQPVTATWSSAFSASTAPSCGWRCRVTRWAASCCAWRGPGCASAFFENI